jgi:hypothetical protein
VPSPENGVPRVTFGMIVLNGEPFLRYNVRALYPFAHQIIIVEGASPFARHIAGPNGHSVDTTLDTLRALKRDEDPEEKLAIVTAEDEGHSDGFWPGEKDEQSRAYATRATGDWLWQVDVDEFYHAADMERVFGFLSAHPGTTCVTFDVRQFWGGFNYILEGGFFMGPWAAGEPRGAFRRLFRFGPGYRYVTHRPPTIEDGSGHDLAYARKRNLSRGKNGVLLYHYTAVFPDQVLPKGRYYRNLGWTSDAVGLAHQRKFEAFERPLDLWNGLRIYTHRGTFNWIRRFKGRHPAEVSRLISDISDERILVECRRQDDLDELVRRPLYLFLTACLLQLERIKTLFAHSRYALRVSSVRGLKAVARTHPSWFAMLPDDYRRMLWRRLHL